MQITLDEAQLREAVTEYLKDAGVTVEPAEIKFIAGRGPNSGHRAEITLQRLKGRAAAAPQAPAREETPEPAKKPEPEAPVEEAPAKKSFLQVSEERDEEPLVGSRKPLTEAQQAALERARQMAEEDDPEEEEAADDLPWDADNEAIEEEVTKPKSSPRVTEMKTKQHKPGTLGSQLFGPKKVTQKPGAKKSLFDK